MENKSHMLMCPHCFREAIEKIKKGQTKVTCKECGGTAVLGYKLYLETERLDPDKIVWYLEEDEKTAKVTMSKCLVVKQKSRGKYHLRVHDDPMQHIFNADHRNVFLTRDEAIKSTIEDLDNSIEYYAEQCMIQQTELEKQQDILERITLSKKDFVGKYLKED
jgi:hypothetical protein